MITSSSATKPALLLNPPTSHFINTQLTIANHGFTASKLVFQTFHNAINVLGSVVNTNFLDCQFLENDDISQTGNAGGSLTLQFQSAASVGSIPALMLTNSFGASNSSCAARSSRSPCQSNTSSHHSGEFVVESVGLLACQCRSSLAILTNFATLTVSGSFFSGFQQGAILAQQSALAIDDTTFVNSASVVQLFAGSGTFTRYVFCRLLSALTRHCVE